MIPIAIIALMTNISAVAMLEFPMPTNQILSLLFLFAPALMGVPAMLMLEAQRRRDDARFGGLAVKVDA